MESIRKDRVNNNPEPEQVEEEEEEEEDETEEESDQDMESHSLETEVDGKNIKSKLRDSSKVKDKNKDKESDDLFVTMKFPLFIGCLFGLMPLAEKKNSQAGKHIGAHHCISWIRLRTLISIMITFLMGFNTLAFFMDVVIKFSTSRQNSIGDIANGVAGIWFFAAGFHVYLFFLLRSPKTCTFFHSWRKGSKKIHGTAVSYPNLRRHMNIICFSVLLSTTGEHILFHIYSMRTGVLVSSFGRKVTFWDLLEDFYESNQYMKRIFDYNPTITVILFLLHKCTLFACNFSDILLMMISLAVSARFDRLNKYIESHMDFETALPIIKPGCVSWRKVRRNFLLIVKSLDDADQIFYPLIWLSYSTNIFLVCNQLFMGIHDRNITSTLHKSYVIWSFIHLAAKTLAVNIFAARIHDNATKLIKLLQFCSPDEYDHHVRRLERFLGSRDIGFTGNGVFVVTRSFIMMIISAIFTLEVVFLQNSTFA